MSKEQESSNNTIPSVANKVVGNFASPDYIPNQNTSYNKLDDYSPVPSLLEILNDYPGLLSATNSPSSSQMFEICDNMTETQLYHKLKDMYFDLFKKVPEIKSPNCEDNKFREALRERLIKSIDDANLLRSMIISTNSKSPRLADNQTRTIKKPKISPHWVHKPRIINFRKFTQSQTDYLNSVYKSDSTPSQEVMLEISKILQIDYQRVRRWFCNKRRPKNKNRLDKKS